MTQANKIHLQKQKSNFSKCGGYKYNTTSNKKEVTCKNCHNTVEYRKFIFKDRVNKNVEFFKQNCYKSFQFVGSPTARRKIKKNSYQLFCGLFTLDGQYVSGHVWVSEFPAIKNLNKNTPIKFEATCHWYAYPSYSKKGSVGYGLKFKKLL